MIRQVFKHKLIVILSLFVCFLISESHASFNFTQTSYSFSINENLEKGRDVGTVRITGNPSNVRYGFAREDDEYSDYNYFTIGWEGDDRGKIKVKIPPDYETKPKLKVRVNAQEKGGGRDASVNVIITVIDDTTESANNAPVFSEGTSTTRFLNPFTQLPGSFGEAISATDADTGDTIEYYISQDPYGHFSINADGILSNEILPRFSGRWIGGTVNRVYNIVVGVRDNHKDSDYIKVSVIFDSPPEFTEPVPIKRSIMEGLASGTAVGEPISVRDRDADKITFGLSGPISSNFSINSNGVIHTTKMFDINEPTEFKGEISLQSTFAGYTQTASGAVHITVQARNNPPVFSDGASTSRSIAENTASGIDIGSPISATDVNDDSLTYTLGGTDAAAFGIVSTSGQLQTNAALDYETKTSYSVTVSVSDGNGGSDSISVTIQITDVDETEGQPSTPPSGGGAEQPSTPPGQPPVPQNNAPVFSDGASTTRSIAENTASDVSIGTPVSATDADNDTLTYTLGGTDAAAFSIVSTSGQLQTNAALDYENKTSYSVTVSVSDGNGGSDSISVTIRITDVDETEGQPSTPPSGGGTEQPSTPPGQPPVPQNNALSSLMAHQRPGVLRRTRLQV